MINNDYRRMQAIRYEKYVLAAARIGIEIPNRYKFDLEGAVNWLSKQGGISGDVKIWPAVVAEARRLFPETFQTDAQ